MACLPDYVPEQYILSTKYHGVISEESICTDKHMISWSMRKDNYLKLKKLFFNRVISIIQSLMPVRIHKFSYFLIYKNLRSWLMLGLKLKMFYLITKVVSQHRIHMSLLVPIKLGLCRLESKPNMSHQ